MHLTTADRTASKWMLVRVIYALHAVNDVPLSLARTKAEVEACDIENRAFWYASLTCSKKVYTWSVRTSIKNRTKKLWTLLAKEEEEEEGGEEKEPSPESVTPRASMLPLREAIGRLHKQLLTTKKSAPEVYFTSSTIAQVRFRFSETVNVDAENLIKAVHKYGVNPRRIRFAAILTEEIDELRMQAGAVSPRRVQRALVSL